MVSTPESAGNETVIPETSTVPTPPASPSPEGSSSPSTASSSTPQENKPAAVSARGDDGHDGPEGPEGPPDADGKRKRKRRKKPKAVAGAPGPQGPQGPQGPDGPGAPGGGEAHHGHNDRRDGNKRPPRNDRERTSFTVGEEVFGKVTAILDHAVMVDLTGKALAIFDRGEFAADDLMPAVGDKFVAQVLGDGTRGGLVVLTRKLLREEETKPKLEQAFKDKTPVDALITGVIKGGVEVLVDGVRGFAPASHVDLRMGADLTHLIGQRLPFVVEQYAKKGRDVVLSRKVLLEEEYKKTRATSLAKLKEGSVVKAIVRSLVNNLGAFVAIPEGDDIEGLVHLSELSHDPRARLHDVVKVGDEIEVKIQKIDDKGKLWLSKKATEADPWEQLKSKYAVNTRHTGKVASIQPFGVFVELEPGQDGLIYLADLSFKRIEKATDVVQIGQEIEVVIHAMDTKTRKITLHPALPEAEASLKQKVAPHKPVKALVVGHEGGGLVVRILGVTGRTARAFIPAGQTNTARGTDLRKIYPLNSEIDAKVIEIDPRRGEAKLSIKALKEETEKAAYNEYRATVAREAKFGTFGDLLRKTQNQG